MSLDIECPPVPDLETGMDAAMYEDAEVAGGTDYRRDELKGFLEDGAWADAFDQWTSTTDLSPEEFAIAEDLDLFSEFDFFWDDFADRVGYHAPGIPEDWKERDYHSGLTSWETASSINASLTELGQIVSDVLKDNYVDWEAKYEAPDDLPEFD